MWKIIFLLLAAYVLYKLFSNDMRKKRRENEQQEKEEIARKKECGEMVQDPECGAYVSVDDSISVRDGKNIYYFCSYDCRDKYLKKLQAGDTSAPPKRK